jgi:hypothetical protein
MSESDAETIWMSRIAMNMPKTIAMNATSFRVSKPESACGAEVAMVVVAAAMAAA